MQLVLADYPDTADKLHDRTAVNFFHCGELHEMVDPAVPLAAVLQYIRQAFFPFVNRLLQKFNVGIVFPLIGKIFFFGENPAYQVLIELCLESLDLRPLPFVCLDLRGILLNQFPVDPLLTNTGQQSIQGSYIFNMAFQAVLHTLDQVCFL